MEKSDDNVSESPTADGVLRETKETDDVTELPESSVDGFVTPPEEADMVQQSTVPKAEDPGSIRSGDQNGAGCGSLWPSSIQQTNGEEDSDDSSREEVVPAFRPRLQVEFTGKVHKDGETLIYEIRVWQKSSELSESLSKGEGRKLRWVIRRQYEDFEYMSHCLMASRRSIAGIIIPPLPPRAPADAGEAIECSRRKMGEGSRELLGDEVTKQCRELQSYLQDLLTHPILGREKCLETFLTQSEAPARAKVKKGLFARLADSLDTKKAANHPDCDDFFVRQKEWVAVYGHIVGENARMFHSVLESHRRMSGQIQHLSTALSLAVPPHTGRNQLVNRYLSHLSQTLDSLNEGAVELEIENGASTLAFQLDRLSRYVEAMSAMLLRRSSLMIAYETANREMDRAKPHKRIQAERTREIAEKEFGQCSEVAKDEIRAFHRQRVSDLQSALKEYAMGELMVARRTHEFLRNRLATFQNLPNAPIVPESFD